MTIKASEFDIKTPDENAQSLADLHPDGIFWEAKNIDGSNFRQLLIGLAGEIQRAQSYIQSVAEDYIPNLTNSFINDWENIVGIPDDCFTKNGISEGDQSSDAGRRRDILIKLSKMNLQTTQDYIDLAAAFNTTITINNSTGGFDQFNWEIVFQGATTTGWDYPWTIPDEIVWGSPFQELIRCIFDKQRPAHTLLNYSFS